MSLELCAKHFVWIISSNSSNFLVREAPQPQYGNRLRKLKHLPKVAQLIKQQSYNTHLGQVGSKVPASTLLPSTL